MKTIKMTIYNPDKDKLEEKEYQHSSFKQPHLGPHIRAVHSGPQGHLEEKDNPSFRPPRVSPVHQGTGSIRTTGSNSKPFGNK